MLAEAKVLSTERYRLQQKLTQQMSVLSIKAENQDCIY